LTHHTQKERKENIKALHDLIIKQCSQTDNGQVQVTAIMLDNLVALASFKLGFSEHTTVDYLMVLATLHLVNYNEESKEVTLRDD